MGMTEKNAQIGNATRANAQEDEGRVARLEELKLAIENGTYKVPSAALADSLLRRMLKPNKAFEVA